MLCHAKIEKKKTRALNDRIFVYIYTSYFHIRRKPNLQNDK